MTIRRYIISNFSARINLIFEHVSGKDNKVANFLSRWVNSQSKEEPKGPNVTKGSGQGNKDITKSADLTEV